MPYRTMHLNINAHSILPTKLRFAKREGALLKPIYNIGHRAVVTLFSKLSVIYISKSKDYTS